MRLIKLTYTLLQRLIHSCVAYTKPPVKIGRRGRSRKKGERINLIDLFEMDVPEFLTFKLKFFDKMQES